VVYLEDLEDPGEARRAFQNFIAMYPKSDKAAEANEKLKQLDRQGAARASAHAAALPAPPAPREEVSEGRPSGLMQVTAVRHWVGPNYLRIVIGVENEVKFVSVRLSNPDRIVLDLQNAHLSPDLGGKTFPVENGFLRQIRVAQFSPDVARVVLDVEKIESYSIFSLPNPFRLVIDVQGVAQTQMARTVKPSPSPTAEVRKPEKTQPPTTPSPAAAEPTETVVKTPLPNPAPLKPEAEPSTPPGDKEESSTISPLPVGKHGKKSKEKEAPPTTAADITPPIQPAGPTESGSRTLTRALG